jgi:hypothetical protein
MRGWSRLVAALSRWMNKEMNPVPPGFPTQAEIEASESGYTPGGWDVTANDPKREPVQRKTSSLSRESAHERMASGEGRLGS